MVGKTNIVKVEKIEDLPVGELEEVRVRYVQENSHHREGQRVLLHGNVVQKDGQKRLYDIEEAMDIEEQLEKIKWISFIVRS